MCITRSKPKLFIPIEPMGAVRTTQKQKYVDASYKKYAEYKKHIALLMANRLEMIPPGIPIILTDVTFYMPIPKSGKTSYMVDGKRKQFKVSEGDPFLHTPDLDNLLKGLKDSLKGIAWVDDNQVFKYTNPQKVYSEYPGIEFGIEILGG